MTQYNQELTPTYIKQDDMGLWEYGLIKIEGVGREQHVIMGKCTQRQIAEKNIDYLAVNGHWILENLADE